MKKFTIIIFLLVFVAVNPAYGHKLITHDDSHRSFDTALPIPDHKISWAIYEDLESDGVKFYSFEANQGDSFYAGIVIPKIQGLEDYAPTMVLVDPKAFEDGVFAMDSQLSIEKILYEGEFPGKEFYEPFGQVTYWERQEIRTEIPTDGQYFIVVMDEKNQNGKYSLAIGTIEDFSVGDFFTILPQAWFETKLFVDDYPSIGILITILVSLFLIPITVFIKKRKSKNTSKITSKRIDLQ